MNGSDFVRQGARRGGLIGGLTGAAAGAALWGLPKQRRDGNKVTTKQRLIGGAVGAAAMGYAGHGLGSSIGGLRNAVKWNSGHRPRPSMPDWLKGAKNKADAKRAFHAASRKAHPDLGGNREAQEKLNIEYNAHKGFFKEAAFLDGFVDELEKIAMARGHASR